ncbi:MAG: GatB/YqeY domain-containing protein [Acidiferrobacterales bacterium]
MSLKERIKQDMKEALRGREQQRLGAIRLLQAAIQRRELDERTTLGDAEVIAVAEKLIKQSQEAAEQFDKGGRPELVDKENRDIAVWQAYMPARLSSAELDTLISEALTETGANSMKDMGRVMGSLKPKLQGRADMGEVGAKVKAKLGG